MSSEFKLPLPARLLRCESPRRPVPAYDDRLVDAHLDTFAELEAQAALEPLDLQPASFELLLDELAHELDRRGSEELAISLTLLDEQASEEVAEVA